MEAKDIKEKKFAKGLNGYKMEEVDDFLEEMSAEFSNLKKLSEEQEKKMEVLADKIREYNKGSSFGRSEAEQLCFGYR